jgi:hypothetical protein
MTRTILLACFILAIMIPAMAQQKGTAKKKVAQTGSQVSTKAPAKKSEGDEEVRREVVNGELYESVFRNGWRISSKKIVEGPPDSYKNVSQQMFRVLTENGNRVVMDKQITLSGSSHETFEATHFPNGYNVALTFPSEHSASIDGYFSYGDSPKRLPLDPKRNGNVGYLHLKIPSKPNTTAHIYLKENAGAAVECRLMVVEY